MPVDTRAGALSHESVLVMYDVLAISVSGISDSSLSEFIWCSRPETGRGSSAVAARLLYVFRFWWISSDVLASIAIDANVRSRYGLLERCLFEGSSLNSRIQYRRGRGASLLAKF
jgi:hypothetical protein